MKIGVFSVYDKKTAAYMQPFFQVTRGQAMRTVQDTMNDENSLIGRHPEDFALYQVGFFDDLEGVCGLQEEDRFVCNADEIVQPSLKGLQVVREGLPGIPAKVL